MGNMDASSFYVVIKLIFLLTFIQTCRSECILCKQRGVIAECLCENTVCLKLSNIHIKTVKIVGDCSCELWLFNRVNRAPYIRNVDRPACRWKCLKLVCVPVEHRTTATTRQPANTTTAAWTTTQPINTTTTTEPATATAVWTTTKPAFESGVPILVWAILATIMLVCVMTVCIVYYCRKKNGRRQYEYVPATGLNISGIEMYTMTPSPICPATPESMDTPSMASSPIANRTRSKKKLDYVDEI